MKVVTVFLVATVFSTYATACKHVMRHKSNGRNSIRKRFTSSDFDGSEGENITHKDLDTFLTDRFNVNDASPINCWTQKFWETKVSNVTYNYLMDHKTEIILTVIPIYENVRAVRPKSFVILVKRDGENDITVIVKAYMPNPITREAISPYVYSTRTLPSENYSKNFPNVRSETLFIHQRGERVEVVLKYVEHFHVTDGTGLDQRSKNWSKRLAGDDPRYSPGLLISQKLGGRGTDTFNLVPMTSGALKSFEELLVTPTLDFLEDPENLGQETILTVIVMYADNATTCPVGFVVLRSDTSRPKHPADSVYIPNQ